LSQIKTVRACSLHPDAGATLDRHPILHRDAKCPAHLRRVVAEGRADGVQPRLVAAIAHLADPAEQPILVDVQPAFLDLAKAECQLVGILCR